MIPDEAVEAAARAVWEHGDVIQTREYAAELASAALEAAAQHLIQGAKADAWDEGADAILEDWQAVNPYRSGTGG